MKKMVTMLLAVLFVVSLAGGALATLDCNLSCPDVLPKTGTVRVNYNVVPLTGLWACDSVSLCTYIGCPSMADLDGRAKEFEYAAIATGCGLRKITGEIASVLPTDVDLKIKLKAPTAPGSSGTSAGWVMMETTPHDLVTGIEKLCLDSTKGYAVLSAGPNACKGSGCVVMTLTILDQA